MNPILTPTGMSLNVHSMQCSRAARDHVYASSTLCSSSPHASIVTDDSFTLYSESADSIPISNQPVSSAARKLHQSRSSSG